MPDKESDLRQAVYAAISGAMPTGDGRFIKITGKTAKAILQDAKERHGHLGVPIGKNLGVPIGKNTSSLKFDGQT